MVVSTEVVHPSQNSASSGSQNLKTGHYYSQNAYARDESNVRQHTITTANNAEGTRDAATAIFEPVQVSPIEPLHPYYSVPVELTYPYHSTPAEVTNPLFGLPLEYTTPHYSAPTVPYLYPPYTADGDPLYPYYGLPTPGYYEYQHEIPYIASPFYQAGYITAEPTISPKIEIKPVGFVDPTLLQPIYPEFPFQTHYSANNNFKGVSAVANPVAAESQIVTDNTAYSKKVLPVVEPILV